MVDEWDSGGDSLLVLVETRSMISCVFFGRVGWGGFCEPFVLRPSRGGQGSRPSLFGRDCGRVSDRGMLIVGVEGNRLQFRRMLLMRQCFSL